MGTRPAAWSGQTQKDWRTWGPPCSKFRRTRRKQITLHRYTKKRNQVLKKKDLVSHSDPILNSCERSYFSGEITSLMVLNRQVFLLQHLQETKRWIKSNLQSQNFGHREALTCRAVAAEQTVSPSCPKESAAVCISLPLP